MAKTVKLDNITLMSDGSISIRWQKVLVDPDTNEEYPLDWHRTVVDCDGDYEAQLDAAYSNLEKDYGFVINKDEITKTKTLVGKIDAIQRADPEIEALRSSKLEARQING